MTLEETFGSDHLHTATTEAGPGKLFMTMHRNGEAEVLLEKSIPVLERTHKAGDANLPIMLTNLAEAYRLDGRYAKANHSFAACWQYGRPRQGSTMRKSSEASSITPACSGK